MESAHLSDGYNGSYRREDSRSPSNGEILSFEHQSSFEFSDSGDISADLDGMRYGAPNYESEGGGLDRANSICDFESDRFERTNSFMWEEEREKEETEISEVETMKERFAKLLLGEDMSGGSKGVCCALAISNAITNLSASVFGERWKLAPISPARKKMWRKEMEWLLCVSDHIVELVPAWHVTPDGHQREIMVTKQRADLHANLPALRKLDNMLLETLDSFEETEFWYEKPGSDNFNAGVAERHKDKWWLPMPRVPESGLSENARRHLQHHRDIASQVLKASMAINSQVLSEMEIPDAYVDSLPKTAKAALGDHLYRIITMESCSPEHLLVNFDLTSEHSALEVANKLESATYVWRRRVNTKTNNPLKDPKSRNMGKLMRDLRGNDASHCEEYADRAEASLLLLRQRCPALPQTALDGYKIQYNRDVGRSILESYSRVLESMASNIVSRVEDVLYADDLVRNPSLNLRSNSAPTTVAQRFGMDPLSVMITSGIHECSADAWESSPNYSPTPSQTPTSPLSVKSDSSFRSRMWRRRPPGLPAPSRAPEPMKFSSVSEGSIDSVLDLTRADESVIGISAGSPLRNLGRVKSLGGNVDSKVKKSVENLPNGADDDEDDHDHDHHDGDYDDEGINIQPIILSPRRARSRSGPITKEDMAQVGII